MDLTRYVFRGLCCPLVANTWTRKAELRQTDRSGAERAKYGVMSVKFVEVYEAWGVELDRLRFRAAGHADTHTIQDTTRIDFFCRIGISGPQGGRLRASLGDGVQAKRPSSCGNEDGRHAGGPSRPRR